MEGSGTASDVLGLLGVAADGSEVSVGPESQSVTPLIISGVKRRVPPALGKAVLPFVPSPLMVNLSEDE